MNVGLNKTEKAVLRLLIEDSDRTADVIAAETGVTKRTIERAFVSLQEVTIFITYADAYEKTAIFRFVVGAFEEHWYGDKVEFMAR